MKKIYAKIIDGRLQYMGRVPNVVNATEETREQYARENGFKELVSTTKPGRFYDMLYTEDETTITETWTPYELEQAKGQALDEVQNNLTRELRERRSIECDGFSNLIIYDQDALTNATGLTAGDMFIDAADEVHQLTADDILHIQAALKNYRLTLYAAATTRRASISAATTVDEVERALNGN